MLCRTPRTVAELCVLALILLAERGISQEDGAEALPVGKLSSEEPATANTELSSPVADGNDDEDPFACPEGQHFEPHIGCTKGPRRYSVSYDLRILAMALATLIGVGVPCLVFIGLCFLLSDKDEEEVEAEDDDDIEAKANDEDHKDTRVSGDTVTFDVQDSQHKLSVE